MSEKIKPHGEFFKGAVLGAAVGIGIAEVVKNKDYIRDRIPLGKPIDPYRFYKPGIIEQASLPRAAAEIAFSPFIEEIKESGSEHLLSCKNFLETSSGNDFGLFITPNHTSHADSWIVNESLINHGMQNAIFLAGPHVTRNPFYRMFPTILVASPTLMPRNYDERVQMHEVTENAKVAEEEAIKQKRPIVGYLEGTRSKNGVLGKIGGGAMELLNINHDKEGKTRLLILPVGLQDTHKNMPKGNLWPKKAIYCIKYGEPFYFEDMKHLKRKQQADFLRVKIAELLPENMH